MDRETEKGQQLCPTLLQATPNSQQNPLKRVRTSQNQKSNGAMTRIQEESGPQNTLPQQLGSKHAATVRKPRANLLGKRNKIRSEDSESLVMNPNPSTVEDFSGAYKQESHKKIKSQSAVLGGGDFNKIEEELELDPEKVTQFQNRQEKRQIPAIKMTLRIFETMPKSFYKKYDCVKEIGRGAYGTVFKGLNNVTGQFVAIKRITLRNKIEDFNELHVLKEASHPHIITPLEYCVFENNLYIVSEFCEGGSLFQRILKKKSLGEATCRRIALSMLSALNYCHNVKNIVHRDIKPENMVFGSEDDEKDIRLIDFGLSTILKDEQNMEKKCGSAFYLAPEVLKGTYNFKCDIWSLGVVLFVMITGRPLIYGRGQKQILSKVFGLKSVDKLVQATLGKKNPELLDFILKMLRVDPKKRWDSKRLLKHKWLKGADKGENPSSKNIEKTMSTISETF